jgi:hypothetical protein
MKLMCLAFRLIRVSEKCSFFLYSILLTSKFYMLMLTIREEKKCLMDFWASRRMHTHQYTSAFSSFVLLLQPDSD